MLNQQRLIKFSAFKSENNLTVEIATLTITSKNTFLDKMNCIDFRVNRFWWILVEVDLQFDCTNTTDSNYQKSTIFINLCI